MPNFSAFAIHHCVSEVIEKKDRFCVKKWKLFLRLLILYYCNENMVSQSYKRFDNWYFVWLQEEVQRSFSKSSEQSKAKLQVIKIISNNILTVLRNSFIQNLWNENKLIFHKSKKDMFGTENRL